MSKKIKRCDWAGETSAQYIEYHDTEWGVPVWDDGKQFEFLILEGAQAGLSWSTILNKRQGYRKNFADFDAVKVARFTQKRVDRILQDPGIVRNKLKVHGAVANASTASRAIGSIIRNVLSETDIRCRLFVLGCGGCTAVAGPSAISVANCWSTIRSWSQFVSPNRATEVEACPKFGGVRRGLK